MGDDLAPVGGFLAGKLVSHTLLGALLGAVGGAVQLSIGARTGLQIAAGLLVIVFGLAQLGVPWFREFVIEPPLSWMRIVRNRARSQAASRIAESVFGGEPADASTVSTRDGKQTMVIIARTGSYSPKNVEVCYGVPTTLVVRSDGAQGCVRSFTIPDLGVDEILPSRGETLVELGVLEPGTLRYACGMGMYTGTITIV